MSDYQALTAHPACALGVTANPTSLCVPSGEARPHLEVVVRRVKERRVADKEVRAARHVH